MHRWRAHFLSPIPSPALEEHSAIRAYPVAVRLGVVAENLRVAARRSEKAEEEMDRGGLAGAVGAPFFNAYFHRNALLFCGPIWFERKDYAKAEPFYRQVVEAVEPSSYDHFDALSQLGKINYFRGDFGEAVRCFDTAIQTHKVSENEYLIDTYFWLAKSHLKRNEKEQAKRLLEKIAASDVKYEKRPQAVELLQRVS